ncbi:hypothetical protein CRE_13441 [Caenorhabditis remanei]|uniref:Uncharacterized protein n=2 Tax=Caenorhabditis TaxID=6237 RepID=E3MR03_CAERE|nr:hypothetical protein CRE_12419 [Caenorhabditis remanei]EFP07234.1 hypothetical protein CRE_13441 [Caenorhabditis remanei]
MDPVGFRSVIYNACETGQLQRIRIFMANKVDDKNWIHEVLNSSGLERYPIVIAARNGHVAVVEYLLTVGADPSVRGTVEFDNDQILGTPPLWAASAAGHLAIVKLLVETGKADVNQATNTQSTPLRGACYDGHLDIVKYLLEKGADPHIPNRHGHTCLMISAYRNKVEVVRELLKNDIDVNCQTERGNTALHDAAESGNVEVVKILLSHGAILKKDHQGVDPLMGSALSGYPEVLNLLADEASSSIPRRDALKLLGSTYLDKKMDAMSAMACWRQAIEVPLHSDEMKFVHELETFFEPLAVYEYQEEAQTMNQIELLDGNIEAQRMQSLVIRERILGGAHTDVHYYLRFRGAVYCDMGQMNRCYELWKHALKLQQSHFAPLYFGTVTTLQSFQETFSMTLNDYVNNHHANINLRVKSTWVKYVFDQVCEEMERAAEWKGAALLEDTECCGKDKCQHSTVTSEFKKLVVIAVHLMNVLERISLPSARGDEVGDDKALSLNIPRLVKVCRKLRVPLLHYALEEKTPDQNTSDLGLPKAAVLEQLLEHDLDVNAADDEMNTPMHLVLGANEFRKSLVRALLNYGTWIFARNKKGQVVYAMMHELASTESISFDDMRLGRHVTLLGLASNAMRVRYDGMFDGVEKDFPLELRRFYLAH